jgi:hypothetical protein
MVWKNARMRTSSSIEISGVKLLADTSVAFSVGLVALFSRAKPSVKRERVRSIARPPDWQKRHKLLRSIPNLSAALPMPPHAFTNTWTRSNN